jgi:hypothetical protein
VSLKAQKIRPLLMPGETPLQFDERTERKLHLYPDDCERCGSSTHAVITRGFEGEGESWCLQCGSES